MRITGQSCFLVALSQKKIEKTTKAPMWGLCETGLHCPPPWIHPAACLCSLLVLGHYPLPQIEQERCDLSAIASSPSAPGHP